MKSQRTNLSILDEPKVSAIADAAEWDDELLVNRTLAGDPVAENAIYRRYAPYLLNLATRLTRTFCDGDDVVQETFLRAFSKLHQLENPHAIRSWLIRIMISRIRKRYRIKRFRAFLHLNESEADSALHLLAAQYVRPDLLTELKDIDSVLRQTQIDRRTAWMLHRVEGMSIYETAQATGRSPSTVKRYVAAVDVAIQSKWRHTS